MLTLLSVIIFSEYSAAEFSPIFYALHAISNSLDYYILAFMSSSTCTDRYSCRSEPLRDGYATVFNGVCAI